MMPAESPGAGARIRGRDRDRVPGGAARDAGPGGTIEREWVAPGPRRPGAPGAGVLRPSAGRISAALVFAAFALGCDRGEGPGAAPSPTPGPASVGAPLPALSGDSAAAPSGPLLVWAEASPGSGAAPLEVAFRAQVKEGVGAIEFRWSFGDATPESTERDPRHTFTRPGQYRVELRARAGGGVTDADELLVVVK